MRTIVRLIDAQKELYHLSGDWLSLEDEQQALTLPHSELDPDASDYRYREWQRSRGMERIVQGALRLAAHQVLGERPHFGGKYSEDLIDDGIAAVERSREPPPKPPTKKGKAVKGAFQRRFGDRLSTEPEPSVRRNGLPATPQLLEGTATTEKPHARADNRLHLTAAIRLDYTRRSPRP